MRHSFSPAGFRDGVIEMLPVSVGMIAFGVVTGAAAAGIGASWPAALAMSALMFSGAAQIVTCQLIKIGAPVAVIVLTCFIMSLRFMMYSAALAPHLKAVPDGMKRAIAFVLADQAFAVSLRRFHSRDDPAGNASHNLGAAFTLWFTWQVTCMMGYFIGATIPPAWSLDFAAPLCFVSILAPVLQTPANICAAIVAGITVLASSALPMKLNMIVAGIAGIITGVVVESRGWRWTRR